MFYGLDDGFLTDSLGRKIDFTNCVYNDINLELRKFKILDQGWFGTKNHKKIHLPERQ